MGRATVAIDWNNDAAFDAPGEDVTGRVLGRTDITCVRGKDQIRAVSPPMTGQFACELDNRSRDYSFENVSGPLFNNLKPGRRVRLGYTVPGAGIAIDFEDGTAFDLENGQRFEFEGTPTYYDVWRGLLDDLPQHPEKERLSVDAPALGTISRLRGQKVSTRLYQNITTDVALGYLLDAANWPAADRVFQTGQVSLLWWWLDNEDAFDAMVSLLLTEGPSASIYEDQQGRIVFENRNSRAGKVSVFTFSDQNYILVNQYDPGIKSVINQATVSTVSRNAKALAPIWQYGQTLVLAANETRKIQITSSDPFTNAQVPSAAPSNASQTLAPSATLTTGAFTLSFRGVTTSSLNYNATAAQIQSALEALSSIGTGNVVCTGGPINTTSVLVTFLGSLGGQAINDLIAVASSTLNPVNVGATIEVSEIQVGGGIFIEIQLLAPSGTLTAGTFTITVSASGGSGTTSSLNYNATAAEIQTALRAIFGFGLTACFGGPINTSSVQVNFVNYAEPMPLMAITGSGLSTSAAGATINITQGSKGGVADYALTAGAIASKSLDRSSGASCTLTITAGASGATLTGLQLRAQPVTSDSNRRITNSVDASASQSNYGLRAYSPATRAEISDADALTLVNNVVSYYSQPRPTVMLATVDFDATVLAQQLSLQVSDKVTIVDSQTGINADFFIERISHRIAQGPRLFTELGCEKAL